jgi:FAD/FMN-containing dehydrogenase
LYAFVGSLGLLGILTSITVQLQRISSGYVSVRSRRARSLAELFSLFAEEAAGSDFMEAWLDGFAGGEQLGRGKLTCATLETSGAPAPAAFSAPGLLDRLETPLVGAAAHLGRPLLRPGVQTANRIIKGWGGQLDAQRRALFPYTFWPPAALAGYHALLSQGVETFQAFVPGPQAREVFERALRYSQAQGYPPIWCIIKQHRRDPFLLSYQVDGFSLELNYARTRQTAAALKQLLEAMIAMVIEAGGRFYLAKDHFLTQAQYRHSLGDTAVDAFLQLKQRYDPQALLQSDLYRRLFQPRLG